MCVRVAGTGKVLLAAALLLLAVAGCTEQAPDSGGTAAETVYRHAMDGAPRSLDPAQASSIYAKMLVVNLYDTLYRYQYLARPYQLTPNLAEGMPQVSADGLIYTIRIRQGAQFIDDPAFPRGRGRAVTAADFVYSIKRHFDPATRSQGAWLWQNRIVGLDQWKDEGADYDREVPGLRALDEHTVQIQLVSPFPQLTHTLAQGFAAIVPREAVEHYGQEFPIRPVGSGPYRLSSFDSTGAVLQRNPAFREPPFSLEAEGYDVETQGHLGLERLEGRVPPFTDRIEVAFIAEDAARWNAFISGETDFIKVPVTQFDRVLASRNPPRLNDDMAERFRLAADLGLSEAGPDTGISAVSAAPYGSAAILPISWARRPVIRRCVAPSSRPSTGRSATRCSITVLAGFSPASSRRSPWNLIPTRTTAGYSATWTGPAICCATPAGTPATCRSWNTAFPPASPSARCSNSFAASWPISATRRKKSAR